jgi:serine/threonine protein kinase
VNGQRTGTVTFNAHSRLLGSGTFGKIVRGLFVANGEEKATAVAVKIASRPSGVTCETLMFDHLACHRDNGHSNLVVPYYGSATDGGRVHCIVLALYDRESGWCELFDFIRENGEAIPPPVAWSIAKQLMQAVQFLHGLGVAHRDIKPENIMVRVRVDGKVELSLLDLGVATRDATSHEVTGSAAYNAPEVFLVRPDGPGYNSFENDLHQLCVTVLVLFTGGVEQYDLYHVDDPEQRAPTVHARPAIDGVFKVTDMCDEKFACWCDRIRTRFGFSASSRFPNTLFDYMLHSANRPEIGKAVAMTHRDRRDTPASYRVYRRTPEEVVGYTRLVAAAAAAPTEGPVDDAPAFAPNPLSPPSRRRPSGTSPPAPPAKKPRPL